MPKARNLPPSQRIRGVLAPVVTPFKADLSPNCEKFIRHCQWLLSQNSGLAVFGTTSEANSMSAEERSTLLDALVTAGIDPSRMMPGTGCCSITETVALTAHAVKHGCAGVLMLPPFYYKDVSEEGLYRYFSEVVQRVGDTRLKIYLYHIPPVTIVGITPKLIERLLKAYPNAIAGMKDSSGDWNTTKTFLDAFEVRSARPASTARAARTFDVFVGSESVLLANIRNGGVGTISATANANPAAIHKLYRQWNTADDADQQPFVPDDPPSEIKCRARSVQQQEISLHDRGVEAGDCDLPERPAVGQGASTAGRAHKRASKVARRGFESDRVRDGALAA
jgi:4-hydroxy-tetrahydrodipicolinate synthase